jgi:hypothetical protein
MNNIKLPQTYIIQKFYQYAGFPKYKKSANVYNGCCIACREGKSWGRKKRLFYIPKKDLLYCQNCGRSWSPINWIKEFSGMSFNEIMNDANNFNSDIFEEPKQEANIQRTKTGTLPEDSINLSDEQQLSYYKNNKIVQDALNFIKRRRLNTLINKPPTYYISLKDFVHKNRLCIPFYDQKGKINFYQTRAIYKSDELQRPKYLSKMNADKTIFGLNNISPEIDYLFIFEGPIDSMAVKNGIAMGGIHLNELQTKEIKPYNLYTKIWILDNQLDNPDVLKKMNDLIERSERVFIWPKKFVDYKDVNEICEKLELDQISPKFFIENSYTGVEALIKIKV